MHRVEGWYLAANHNILCLFEVQHYCSDQMRSERSTTTIVSTHVVLTDHLPKGSMMQSQTKSTALQIIRFVGYSGLLVSTHQEIYIELCSLDSSLSPLIQDIARKQYNSPGLPQP